MKSVLCHELTGQIWELYHLNTGGTVQTVITILLG